jgi:general secretion pathway protein G
MRTRHATRAGFTLAELMVVIVIIGLLATVVVPNLISKLGKASREKAKADITVIAGAVTAYAIENGGRFPDNLDVLVTPDQNGHSFLDTEVVPKDPWGNEYVFEPALSGTAKFRVISYGKDGVPGGEGDDEDIDNIKIKNGEI